MSNKRFLKLSLSGKIFDLTVCYAFILYYMKHIFFISKQYSVVKVSNFTFPIALQCQIENVVVKRRGQTSNLNRNSLSEP